MSYKFWTKIKKQLNWVKRKKLRSRRFCSTTTTTTTTYMNYLSSS
ncbi:MAG TPA: hypothetical protein VE445_11890 [Nitrososphaeraceae archaeon]|nr:hypothetical protein [Nitrososphaeraceae archaeon]